MAKSRAYAVYDNDEDRWHMSFNTKEEAIAEAKAAMEEAGRCGSFSVYQHVETFEYQETE